MSFMMSTVTFVVPLMWDNCREIPEILPEWTVQEISQVRRGRNEERERSLYEEYALGSAL